MQYPLGQPLLFEGESHRVMPGVGQRGKTVGHVQDEEDRGVDAERDARIALLGPDEGARRDERAFGHEGMADAAAPPCHGNVGAELLDGTPDTQRESLLGLRGRQL